MISVLQGCSVDGCKEVNKKIMLFKKIKRRDCVQANQCKLLSKLLCSDQSVAADLKSL